MGTERMAEENSRLHQSSTAEGRLAIPASRPSGLGQKKHHRRIQSRERAVPDTLGRSPGKL